MIYKWKDYDSKSSNIIDIDLVPIDNEDDQILTIESYKLPCKVNLASYQNMHIINGVEVNIIDEISKHLKYDTKGAFQLTNIKTTIKDNTKKLKSLHKKIKYVQDQLKIILEPYDIHIVSKEQENFI